MTDNPQIKPLDEYIKELRTRNRMLSRVIPGLDKTVENVGTYDELYKRLIDESYYICNELINNKNIYSNQTTDRELENVGLGNVERALMFSSSDNINSLNNRTRNNDTNTINLNTRSENKMLNIDNKLSPINKIDNKSAFYSNLKQISNTESKIGTRPNNFNFNNNISGKKPTWAGDELAFLITNVKELENEIAKANPEQEIEKFESKTGQNVRKMEELKRSEFAFVEDKQEMNKRINEISGLISQFDDRFQRLDDYISLYNKTKPDERYNNTGSNNLMLTTNDATNNHNNVYDDQRSRFTNNNNNKMKDFSMTNETDFHRPQSGYSQYLYGSNLNNDHIKINYGEHQYDNYNTNHRNSQNQANNSGLKLADDSNSQIGLVSGQINSLLSEGRIEEAANLWKSANYQEFVGTTLSRSYEMLAQVLKLRDRELAMINNKLKKLEAQNNEIIQKDIEIVELLAELEHHKDNEKTISSLNRTKGNNELKINSLINENALLYKENVKLKALMERQAYFSKSNNFEY